MTAHNHCSWDDRAREGSAVTSIVTALTLGIAFGGLALGIPGWWIAFPVGFGAVMPLAVALAARRGSGSDRSTGGDRDRRQRGERDRHPRGDRSRASGDGRDHALDELRERYARGEIDEREFERRVEGLLATEERR